MTLRQFGNGSEFHVPSLDFIQNIPKRELIGINNGITVETRVQQEAFLPLIPTSYYFLYTYKL